MRHAHVIGVVWALLAVCAPALAQTRPATFVQAVVSNNTPYLNEPFILTVKVFDSTRSANLAVAYPSFRGFGQESYGEPASTVELLEGVQYTVFTQQTVLYPNLPGTYVVDPITVRIPETPFQQEQYLQSASLPVTVLPLPQAPPGYVNAVGIYTVLSSVDLRQTSVGQVVTLSLTVDGRGNIARLLPPDIPFDRAVWRVLPRSGDYTGDALAGRMRFVWQLIPQVAGELIIPGFVFYTFDPATGTYTDHSTAPVVVSVAGSAAQLPAAPIARPAATPLPFAARGPLGIQYTPQSHPAPDVWAWLLPPAAALAAAALRRRQRPAATLRRPHRATLQAAQAELRAAVRRPPGDAYPAIEAALRRFLGSRNTLTLPAAVDAALHDHLRSLGDARYAPATREDVISAAQRTYRLMQELERYT
jgi:hypothetical protein